MQSVSELLATGLDQGASTIVLDAAVAMSALGFLGSYRALSLRRAADGPTEIGPVARC